MAGVLLKQFADSSWQDCPHTATKEVVKNNILPGLGDSLSKVRLEELLDTIHWNVLCQTDRVQISIFKAKLTEFLCGTCWPDAYIWERIYIVRLYYFNCCYIVHVCGVIQ